MVHIHVHCIFNIPIFQFNWYTKRVSLAGVYKSTEVYMLQDSSEDYQDSWEFLDRRLEDLTTIGKFARNVCTGYNICIGTHSKCPKSTVFEIKFEFTGPNQILELIFI